MPIEFVFNEGDESGDDLVWVCYIAAVQIEVQPAGAIRPYELVTRSAGEIVHVGTGEDTITFVTVLAYVFRNYDMVGVVVVESESRALLRKPRHPFYLDKLVFALTLF